MPVFEPDGGRPRLVQPMQPLAGTFLGEVRSLLAEHLPAVVGEPLFTVRSRSAIPDHLDAPELLALDANGRPVVLEVTQVVDDGAIVEALRHAGAAARLTTSDLARAYHPDPTRFSADYSAFRDQVPFARPAEPRYGTRLVLVCSEVAAESLDTLAAVRGPGSPVTVLQVGVMRGPDGHRLLDVSPLAEHEAARRPAEPTSLRLVHRAAPGGAFPVPVPLDDERPEPPFIPTQPPTIPGRAPAASAPPNRPASPLTRPGLPSTQPSVPYNRPLAPATQPVTSSLAALLTSPALQDTGTAPLAARTGSHERIGAAPQSYAAGASLDRSSSAGYASSGAALPELAQLAAVVRAPAPLVWLRVRRGQRLEATLLPDGLIQLADGSLFADPDRAASHAARSEGAVDGWRMWRLGDGGLSLAEVTGR